MKSTNISIWSAFSFCKLLLKWISWRLQICFVFDAKQMIPSVYSWLSWLMMSPAYVDIISGRSFSKQPPKYRSVSSLYVHTFCRIVTKLKLMTKSPFMIQRHSRGLLEVWTTIWSLLVLLQANLFSKKYLTHRSSPALLELQSYFQGYFEIEVWFNKNSINQFVMVDDYGKIKAEKKSNIACSGHFWIPIFLQSQFSSKQHQDLFQKLKITTIKSD